MPEFAILLLATIVIVAAVYAVARGVDVRLALLAAAFALAGLRGDVRRRSSSSSSQPLATSNMSFLSARRWGLLTFSSTPVAINIWSSY